MILRAGLYERVSTDEQAKYGFSIDSQVDALIEYCEKNNMRIVDHYCDDGVSGGKAASRRPEMSRLLDDIQEGKIDIVLFTRLDRWFRNVKEYFKVQEILEANKVEWKAIWEDYDTTTSNGRMAITIFLAIAQNEREKASDRVKAVFEHKRKNKEAIFSNSGTPFGYLSVRDENNVRRLVKNPANQDAVQAFWDHLIKYGAVLTAGKYVNREYGMRRKEKSWRDLVNKEIYTGTFRGVEGYCEPYVSHEEWEKLQKEGGKVKSSKGNRTYIFPGLMRCPHCNRLLKSCYAVSRTGKEYYYYRCRLSKEHLCPLVKQIPEAKLEKWLLSNIETLMKDEIARVEIEKTKPKRKPKTDVAKLREELRRLNVSYRAGNMSDDEYLEESKDLNARIAKASAESAADPAERDLSGLKELLERDITTIYKSLDPIDKRRFWKGFIKEIHVNDNAEILSVDFL